MEKRIEILPCETAHIDKAIAITYEAWTPIFEKYREALGNEMYNDLYGNWKKSKYNRVYAGLTSGRGFVALVDGEIAGFIFYKVDKEKKLGMVEENAVAFAYRGMGIAQKMYDRVFSEMRREGMKYTMVETGLDEAHASARRAYERAGFDKSVSCVRYYTELS